MWETCNITFFQKVIYQSTFSSKARGVAVLIPKLGLCGMTIYIVWQEKNVYHFILCSIVYIVVTQITLFTAIFFVIWSLSIFCADDIDKLLFLAFYFQRQLFIHWIKMCYIGIGIVIRIWNYLYRDMRFWSYRPALSVHFSICVGGYHSSCLTLASSTSETTSFSSCIVPFVLIYYEQIIGSVALNNS